MTRTGGTGTGGAGTGNYPQQIYMPLCIISHDFTSIIQWKLLATHNMLMWLQKLQTC